MDKKRREFLKFLIALLSSSIFYDFLFPLGLHAKNKKIKNSSEDYKKYPLFIKLATKEEYPVYDDKYNPYKEHDEIIAKELYPNSLQEAVNKGIIPYEKPYIDLALPLGIYKNKEAKIDFVKGMESMWNHKKGFKSKEIFRKLRDRFKNKVREEQKNKKQPYYSLRDFRRNELAKAVNLLREVFDKDNKTDKDVKRFLEFILDHIKQNILIGYMIQELLPPSIKGFSLNPVFKIYFVDRLFKEAGKSFIEGYPARYDEAISFGPFQLTNMAVKAVEEIIQKYDFKGLIPSKIEEFENLQQHAYAAALFAYNNWILIGKDLKKKGLLNKFKDGLEYLVREDRKGKRKVKMIIAGITACMHHSPMPTKKRVGYYIANIGKKVSGVYIDFGGMHYKFRDISLNDQLKKYYDKAVEAYLIAKVYHILDNKYGKEHIENE